jgi:hypothetical protein
LQILHYLSLHQNFHQKIIRLLVMDLQGINNSYVLLQRFRFPVDNTTRDAIAVTAANGLHLVSLYTLIVKVALSQVWAAIVFLGVAIFIQKEHTYNRAAATVGLYNASSSQFGVIKLLIMTYLIPMKREIWYPILWVVLAGLTMAGSMAASILIPKFLVIGNAAPVNSSAVYFPGSVADGHEISNLTTAKAFALTVPYFVRSAGQVELTPQNSIVVELENSTDPDFVRINYSYNITAADFGLQHAPGLILYVNGSCYTEYGWLAGPTIQNGDSFTDIYNLWNGSANIYTFNASTISGGPPFAFFKGTYDLNNSDYTNTSYAIVASSINRPSYTASTDPWYKTNPLPLNNSNYPYFVESGRPPLSCWETDRFIYNGISSFNGMPISEWNLTDFNLSAFASLDSGTTTPFLADIIQSVMPYSMMVALGTGLGRSSLKSSTTSAVGYAFNAQTSSILQDLEYLIMASYIATKNIFVETTRFPQAGRDNTIPDVSRTPSSSPTWNNAAPPRPGTGDFVITDPGVATLSVQVLIAIPVAMAAAIGAVALLGLLPTPWKVSQALNATILYSHLHEHEERLFDEDAKWNREGTFAFTTKHGRALIGPRYEVPKDKQKEEEEVKEKEKGKKKGKGKWRKAGFYWLSEMKRPAASSPLTYTEHLTEPATKNSDAVVEVSETPVV